MFKFNVFFSAAFLPMGLNSAWADELLISDMTTFLQSETPANIIQLDPDFFRRMSNLECSSIVDHANLIVQTLSEGTVTVNDLRPIDEEIGRPTFLHDFIERTVGDDEFTTLLGANIVSRVGEDCSKAIDAAIASNVD